MERKSLSEVEEYRYFDPKAIRAPDAWVLTRLFFSLHFLFSFLQIKELV